MNRIIIIISVCFITLMSCDGRARAFKTNTEVLTEHKLLDSFSERTIYIPEQSLEIVTDTLLSNGFKIKIKTFSDMERTVLYSKKKGTILEKKHYRNFKFEIQIEKEDISIYHESFDKLRINNVLNFKSDYSKNSPFSKYHNRSVLKSINIDDESLLEDKIMIDITYYIPETRHYATSTLFIDEKGNARFEHSEIH